MNFSALVIQCTIASKSPLLPFGENGGGELCNIFYNLRKKQLPRHNTFIKTILTAINNLYLLSIYVKFIGLSIFIFVLRESGHVEGTLPSSPNFQYTCKIKKKISDNCMNFQFKDSKHN